MSAEEGPTANEDTSSAASALTPTIKFTVTAAGGTVAFSRDGTRLATGSGGQEQAKVLSTSNGAVVQTLPVEGAPDSIAYSRDGAFVAVGSAGFNQNLAVFKANGTVIAANVSAHANGTTSVRFSPTDTNMLVTAGRDRTTKIWRIVANADGSFSLNLARTMNDGIRVLAMDISPDGNTIASNASGTVHLWSVSDPTAPPRTFTTTNGSAVAYSPSGTIISTGRQLFNATGTLIRNLNWPSTGSVTSTTFTKSGSAVVVGGEDFPNMVDVPTIRYFRVSDGATLTTFDHLGGSNAYVNAVAISPDGASLAYSVATDNTTVLAASPF